MEVIQRMKEVEGVVDDASWDKRGVEVGAEAWEYLESWRAGVPDPMYVLLISYKQRNVGSS